MRQSISYPVPYLCGFKIHPLNFRYQHMAFKFPIVSFLFLLSLAASGQDTLPRFSIVNRGQDRIIISWTNPYGAQIRQLSIQRSFDSLKNFKTILTLPDPTVPQNGYVDTKATNDHMFYRLYILLDSGRYSFSRSRRAVRDNAANVIQNDNVGKGLIPLENLNTAAEKFIFVKRRDSLIGAIPESGLRKFRDSINLTTKDTIFMKGSDTVVLRTYIQKDFYRPSKYIFTERDGNVKIVLPDAAREKYSIKFFEEDLSEVFEIKHVTESVLFLDKSNFMHAGWFNFELYENGKLKEKHKLYVPKAF